MVAFGDERSGLASILLASWRARKRQPNATMPIKTGLWDVFVFGDVFGDVVNYVNFLWINCRRAGPGAPAARPLILHSVTWCRMPAEGSGRRAEGPPPEDRGGCGA
jgi:hypothetical protein